MFAQARSSRIEVQQTLGQAACRITSKLYTSYFTSNKIVNDHLLAMFFPLQLLRAFMELVCRCQIHKTVASSVFLDDD